VIRTTVTLALLASLAPAVRAQVPTSRVWVVDARPMFAVGAESADTLDTFGQLRGVARTLAGEVVVADQHNYALRYFGPTGKFTRAVGRRGDGPGEFQMILRMLHCGDSLYVTEFSSDKWSVFSVAGKYKRTFNMAAMRATPSGAPKTLSVATPYDVHCNNSGVFIGEGWESGGEAKPGAFRPQVPYWLSSSLGTISAPLGTFGGSERWGQTDADGRLRGTGPLPLGREPVIAVGRTHAYLGTADSFDIMVFGLDGKRTGTIHKSLPPVRTTPADIKRYIAVDTAGLNPLALKGHLRFLEQVKWPETLPAYAALVVDADDNLWVQRYPRAGESASQWLIFAPNGAELAHASLPLNLVVYEIGKDYVLGVNPEPPDGVQHVEMFRLTRGGR
jgi:hypothetical protein